MAVELDPVGRVLVAAARVFWVSRQPTGVRCWPAGMEAPARVPADAVSAARAALRAALKT